MADIIEFGKKAEHLRSERDIAIRQRKIEALRKIFQCTRCMVKCAKCGAQIDSQADECTKFAAPYIFCRSCGKSMKNTGPGPKETVRIRTITGKTRRGCRYGRPGCNIKKRSTSTGSQRNSFNCWMKSNTCSRSSEWRRPRPPPSEVSLRTERTVLE